MLYHSIRCAERTLRRRNFFLLYFRAGRIAVDGVIDSQMKNKDVQVNYDILAENYAAAFRFEK